MVGFAEFGTGWSVGVAAGFNSVVIDLQVVPLEGEVGLNRGNKKGKSLL